MGSCGCVGETINKFYKIGDKTIVIERMVNCDFCEQPALVSISLLRDEDRKCFDCEIKEKELPTWMGKRYCEDKDTIVVSFDFKDEIREKLVKALEDAPSEFDYDMMDSKKMKRYQKAVVLMLLKKLKEE